MEKDLEAEAEGAFVASGCGEWLRRRFHGFKVQFDA